MRAWLRGGRFVLLGQVHRPVDGGRGGQGNDTFDLLEPTRH